MSQLHHQCRLVSKQLDSLKKKIAEVSESSGIELDEQTRNDFMNMITSSNGSAFFESLPKDSFQYIFCRQLEAANKNQEHALAPLDDSVVSTGISKTHMSVQPCIHLTPYTVICDRL